MQQCKAEESSEEEACEVSEDDSDDKTSTQPSPIKTRHASLRPEMTESDASYARKRVGNSR